ncbi:MAG: GNAT family N-acetyltransferase [Gemmatimonadota bacterium]|nr:GNAT family N-acetyltransferase [Gemmatimonadota bacterium]
MSNQKMPPRIVTERLVIRCWHEDDAPLLRAAIDGSLEHLRRWMPWALNEPSSMDETRERLRGNKAKFEEGQDFTYGIFSRDEVEVVGGSGLHPRIGKGGLEIGYWIRADRTGRGLATETAKALTEIGMRASGVSRLQIMCDPENAASRRVPEKLGYSLIETRVGDTHTPDGGLRDTAVFELLREWA